MSTDKRGSGVTTMKPREDGQLVGFDLLLAAATGAAVALLAVASRGVTACRVLGHGELERHWDPETSSVYFLCPRCADRVDA